MNKSDVKLLVVLFGVIALMFVIINITKEKGEIAEVYYNHELILSIDLTINKEYTVKGELGDVVLEVKDNKIRVKKENSPRNICSKEGYIGDSSRTLVCLPNKIVVKIIGESDLDGVVY